MNVGYPNAALSGQARESEMPIVVYDPRKGKIVVSEGALLEKMFTQGHNRQN